MNNQTLSIVIELQDTDLTCICHVNKAYAIMLLLALVQFIRKNSFSS